MMPFIEFGNKYVKVEMLAIKEQKIIEKNN